MPKWLLVTQYVALAVASVSMVFLLFAFGHTETATPASTFALAVVACVAAAVAGVIWWADLPTRRPITTGRAKPNIRPSEDEEEGPQSKPSK